jgi:hypothetical protein
MLKYLLVLTALLCPAEAKNIKTPNCDDVRTVVQAVGKKEALRMAREAGASEERIRRARECLKP